MVSLIEIMEGILLFYPPPDDFLPLIALFLQHIAEICHLLSFLHLSVLQD